MGKIVLETYHADRPYAEFITLDKESVLIGRSFNSDVFCPDQHVSGAHAKLQFDGKEWLLSDAGSENGVFIGEKKIADAHVIASGEQFTIGKTKITLYKPDHPVSGALPLRTSLFAWNILLVCLAWTLTVSSPFTETLKKYLCTSNDDSFLKLLSGELVIIIFPLLWSLIWAGTGKLIIKKANFHIHLLSINIYFLLLNFVYAPLDLLVKFNMSNEVICKYGSWFFLAIMILAMAYFSLRFSTHMSKRNSSLISFSVLLVLIIITFAADINTDFKNTPNLNSCVLSSKLRMANVKSLDSFMEANERLFKRTK